MEASALEISISALTSAISALETSSERFAFWLPFCTALVVLGVVGEVYVIWQEYRQTKEAWLRGTTASPEKPSTMLFIVGGVCAIFVALGVTGELSLGIAIEQINGHLKTKNSELRVKTEELIGISNREAGDAKTSAKQASDAALIAGTASRQAKGNAASALSLAGSVQGRISDASKQLAQLSSNAKALEAEEAKTKAELIGLAVCNAPRVLPTWSVGGNVGKSSTDPLKPLVGSSAVIEFLPDPEARRAASNIANALKTAKWDVKPLRSVDGINDGVEVQPANSSSKSSLFGSFYDDASQKASDTLIDFLHSYNWQATSGLLTESGKLIRDNPDFPSGSVRIRVGLYPAVSYISPPASADVNRAASQMNSRFKALREEEERKSLDRIPPNFRRDAEQRREEQRKRESRYSNPCEPIAGP